MKLLVVTVLTLFLFTSVHIVEPQHRRRWMMVYGTMTTWYFTTIEATTLAASIVVEFKAMIFFLFVIRLAVHVYLEAYSIRASSPTRKEIIEFCLIFLAHPLMFDLANLDLLQQAFDDEHPFIPFWAGFFLNLAFMTSKVAERWIKKREIARMRELHPVFRYGIL